MDHHPGWLVDHDERLVLMADDEVDGLWGMDAGRTGRAGLPRGAQIDPIPGFDRVARAPASVLHRSASLRIQRWSRAREYPEASAARTTSKRLPASSSGTVNRVGGSVTLSAMRRHAALFAVLALVLAACTGAGDPSDPTRGWSEAELYRQAKASLDEGEYGRGRSTTTGSSVLAFRSESTPPQGQIDLMYAYFKSREPDSAIGEADRFIRFNPDHPGVEYAFYLKG